MQRDKPQGDYIFRPANRIALEMYISMQIMCIFFKGMLILYIKFDD